ncbi:MAG: SUMF1/EgtB/PvdO family nonheme iron enzyme [Gallionella sp.]|nr:SUMF1/EgtB/PvdO family nonheme iron enzyme [Gallionella sp.]
MINSDFYKKVVALNPDSHRNLRFDATRVNYGFAGECTALAIACTELAQAIQEYPVVFVRGQDQQFSLALLLGVREGENLFVSAAGLWDGAYIPAYLQHYPFVIAGDSQEEPLIVSVDESCAAINADSGELLIDDQGMVQQRLHEELQFMQAFQKEIARTELMVRQLAELDLFVPLNEAVSVGDLYAIDAARFKLIEATVLPDLFGSGALRLAFLHLDSLDNIRKLLNKAMLLAAEKQIKPDAGKKTPGQGEGILRIADQGIQKPILKSRRTEAVPPLSLAVEQQKIQSKQDILKKLIDEKKRVEQEHKERYAQGKAEDELESVELTTVTAHIESKKRAQVMLVSAWGKAKQWMHGLTVRRAGLFAIALTGVVIIWIATGSDGDSLPVSATAHTQSVDDAAMPAASQTDIFADSMLRIAPGNFEMGSSDGDADEQPVLKVNISHEFEIGKTEVTQGQWKAVMGSLPEKLFFKKCGNNCPVENVSWNDVQEFIAKLNAQSGKQYRLPSEAEWEYACRAGATQRYCGGDNPDDLAWYGNEKIGKSPHPVATRKPNAWGLYDMSGNVWEWVEDCYQNQYSEAQRDGRSHTSAQCDARVLRGGSWSNAADTPRAANRYKRTVNDRFNNNGFRLARGLP